MMDYKKDAMNDVNECDHELDAMDECDHELDPMDSKLCAMMDPLLFPMGSK